MVIEEKLYNKILVFLLIALSVTQVLNLCEVFFNQFLDWAIGVGLILFTFVKLFMDNTFCSAHNIPFFIYFIWMIIGVVRGIYTADTYWETKFLFSNSICLSLPVFALLFRQPKFNLSFMNKWNKMLPVYLFLFIIGFIPVYWLHFCMGPVYFLLGAFFFIIPSFKWKVVILGFLVLMFFRIDARSQVIKAILAIAMSSAMLLDRWIPKALVRGVGMSFYLVAIILLYLGITGTYNVFDHSDKEAPDEYVNGKLIEKPDVTADTRTFIYVEVITSAINNDYIWIGRTPARGNDSSTVGKQAEANYGPDAKPERNMNEVCHPNVFTWLGLIGVILYSLLYLHSTILGLFFSNNTYCRYLAALVGFHWLMGWVEDINSFNYMNVGLWMVVGISYSPEFRKMSDNEFKIWFQSLFSEEEFTPYHKLELVKAYFKYKLILKSQKR